MKDYSKGPEDFFDPDNYERASFMADYAHHFESKSTPTSYSGSGRIFSFRKAIIAILILFILGGLASLRMLTLIF